MPILAQDKFPAKARVRKAEMGITNESLRKEFNVHRNSISLAIRVPEALPDLHRKVARRLRLRPAL